MKRDLTSGPLARNLFRLAAPVAAGTMLHASYNLADAFWLGKWSKEALAAPGVCMPFFFIVIAFGMGFGNAGTALVAQYTGAGNHRQADRAAGQVLLLLSVLVAALALPMIILAPQLFALVQVPGEMTSQAVTYLRVFMLGLPFMAFTIAYGSVLRALGDTITVVIVGVLANALNLVLDPFLIFGWAGLPALGTAGAALASLISQVAAALVCYALVRRGRAGLRIVPSDLAPNWPILRKTFSVGLPAAIGNSSNSFGFAALQVMINALGTTAIGAFTIGFRLIHFLHVPSQAMAMAAAPIVGQALGAGKPKLARRAVWVSVALVALVMFLPHVFLMWQGQLIARAFIDDNMVVKETARFLRVVPASSYFFGVLMVLMAAFYGSGHTRPAMALSVLRVWILRLPVAYALGFVLGWGSLGIYSAMVGGNVLCAFAAFWLFRAGAWETAVIPTGTGAAQEADTDGT